MRFFNSILVFAVLIFAILTGCGGGGKSVAPAGKDTLIDTSSLQKDASIPGRFSTQTKLVFDSTSIDIFLDSFTSFRMLENEIRTFYSNRKYAFAWFDTGGMIQPAGNLHNRIINIAEEGLPDKLPYRERFTELFEVAQELKKPDIQTELMLTAQYLEYASAVWGGLTKKQTEAVEWLLPRKALSYSELLDSLSGNNVLRNEPVYRQYHLLKDYLKKYRQIKEQNQLPLIQTDKKKLQPGDSASVIAAIRNWLYVAGDIETNNNSNVYDEAITDAIKRLQKRFGLKEDGITGAGVIAAMNYPVEKRLEAIMVNMERSRWVPVSLQNDFLLVNIPEFKLHVTENDTLAFSMNVVVGKDQHKTVIFSGDVKYVVFSPYWNVPASILKKEILPAIRRNPGYLARHNMEWNGSSVRQKPGPNNSLGLVKFLFPNSHSIYLHDSPAKSLFAEDNRAFSHGCIRVAEPAKLAAWLLREDSTWNPVNITAAMNSGNEKTVVLKKPVPVFITYFTAWVDRAGKLNFRKDIYGRDGQLARLILENSTL